SDEALSTLTPREEKIVRMRFGLDRSGEAHTLEEISHLFGVTRERIRQIESKALKKLRHPALAQKLKAAACSPIASPPPETKAGALRVGDRLPTNGARG